MRELRISKRADPAYVEAFRTLVWRLLRSAGSKEPIAMYLAGGAAMHLYTGARMTDDVDAVFNRKLLLPADLVVIYRDAEGKARSVFFDVNYNETYALLHEDAHQDAVRLPLKGIRGARIFVRQRRQDGARLLPTAARRIARRAGSRVDRALGRH